MVPGIIILGAVRGLRDEGIMAVSALESIRPDVLALSISKESMKAMEEHSRSEGETPEPANLEEEMYIEGLSRFGDVTRPPPCFLMPWQVAKEGGVVVKAIDMDEEHFTNAFCKYVSALEMVRQGRCEKKWARHEFVSQTPEDFVVEWDRVINWLPGYQRLEKAREEWMAKGICHLSEKGKRVLAVVEFERLEGLCQQLDAMGCDYQISESSRRT